MIGARLVIREESLAPSEFRSASQTRPKISYLNAIAPLGQTQSPQKLRIDRHDHRAQRHEQRSHGG
jgi:hypothetical protein